MELQLFTTRAGQPLDWEVFNKHPLGRIFQTIPFHQYKFVLPSKTQGLGRKPWFSVEGGIALQVLKHYYGVSDEKLIQLLNDNKMMQYFCGINLKLGQRIKDTNVVSRWRGWLGRFLNIPQLMRGLQRANVEHWKDHMNPPDGNVADATCYESHVRYPTDPKLLWECISYLHPPMKLICKYIGMPMPRSKYKEQQKKYLAYQRRRKKSHKLTRRVQKRLLYLLNKLLNILPKLLAALKAKEAVKLVKCALKRNFYLRLSTIKKIYEQQQLHYDHPSIKIKDRIVSLAKPYLRAIIRGKETKRVEFGIKVHEMQIDGINFIEHWDFNAFHEGIRMKQTIWKHQYLFKRKCKFFGADQIYANNKNRRYCTRQGIQTCFAQKGKAPADPLIKKQKSLLRSLIGKERSTRLEGSFGNKKNHYLLNRIKARNYYTELSWVFFANLTANAVAIEKRMNAPP